MYYDLNHYKLIHLSLPTFLRKIRRMQWLYLIMKGVRDLYIDFLNYREETLLTLSFNSQVMVMEGMLNRRFPQGGGGIFIDNVADKIQLLFIYQAQENGTVTFVWQDSEGNPVYLYSQEEYFGDTDFIVNVPGVAEDYDEVWMRGLINFYKFAGKRYKIVYY